MSGVSGSSAVILIINIGSKSVVSLRLQYVLVP